MNYAKMLSVGILSLVMCGTLWAQETEFDLSSQRSEVQHVLKVPGHKVDHQGIIINPIPQSLALDESGTLDISGGVALKDKKNKFANDLAFLSLQKEGVKLSIDYGAKLAAKKNVQARSGAYDLTINKKGIAITGYDERGAFYGIQTLRQLVESPIASNGQLPYLTVNDYPDLLNRGVIEGFYGTPWSHEVRRSLIDFYGRFKLNVYMYGPKDDPYHSCPHWRLPYPAQEAENIRELIDACQRNRVDFVWAIHPGQDIKWNEEDRNNLLQKFNWMYDLGVRHFAVYFDDISGEGTNPERQAELLNWLTEKFVEVKEDVSPLVTCPTDYSKLWANPTEEGALAIYGRTLKPGINVFWTGDVVCSDLTHETLDFINTRIRRPAYYWWNYPVTDYVRNILMQGPVYGLDTTLTEKEVCGIVSNPMEHGEASKLAIYGLADYTWNMAGYNAIDNWERGLVELMPVGHDAYRTFAIHSCDTETGYRRDESWETTTFAIADWDDRAALDLEAEFKKVAQTPAEFEKLCTNDLLLKELKPWLVEFEKLGTRGKKAIEIARVYREGKDDARFWEMYVGNLMSADDRKAYDAHKSGTMKLQPFYENAMSDMAHHFLGRLLGDVPTDYKGISSFDNSATILPQLMLDGDTVSHYTSAMAQRPNDWIGVDLRAVRDVREINILQGRNSVDDVDYFDHAILEYSADGENWTALTAPMQQQYVIHWSGDAVKARYVRLKRLESKRTNYAAVRSFEVNPPRIENLGFAVEADAPIINAFDQNPATSCSSKSLAFEVIEGVKGYVLLMNRPTETLTCEQLDKDGNLVNLSFFNAAYGKIELANDQVTKIRITGPAEFFEIVAVK